MGQMINGQSQIDNRLDQNRGRTIRNKQIEQRREATNRLLLTQSTHKTKEENETKGQYSILHNETNSSEWFYIPKE